MMEDSAKALALVAKIEAHLPLYVRPTGRVIRMLREKGLSLRSGEPLQVRKVFYFGDEAGISCHIEVPTKREEALIVSITHLRVDPRHPLASEIRAYQRERTKQIAQANRTEPAQEVRASRAKRQRPATAKIRFDKIRRLRQTDATWLCTVCRTPAWVERDGGPHRPYTILVLEQEADVVRGAKIVDEQPTSDVVLEGLAEAMQRPLSGSGKRARPARILLDHSEIAETLQPMLADVGIRCEYRSPLPMVKETLRHMEAHLTGHEPAPGLLSVPHVTEPLLRDLFEAAADYYRQAPWRWMENEWPIEVRYPPEGEARYAAVLGSGGEVYGLSLYELLGDFVSTLQGEDVSRLRLLGVVFGDAVETPFADLDAIEEHGWPVAGEHAYPLAAKRAPQGEWALPSTSEIAWLAATMRTLPGFCKQYLRADRGMPRPAQATYPLSSVHGGQAIALRYPVSYGELMQDEYAPTLEAFIEDWYWNEPSHEFARQIGSFLFEFLGYLGSTGLSERTMSKHTSNCWAIGKLTCDYGYYDEFSPEILTGEPNFVLEFRRKFSDAPTTVESYRTTWRRLARYVRSLGYGRGDTRAARRPPGV